LARKVEPFILKKGIMYRMGQDNRLRIYLIASKPHIILKEQHDGMVGGHFVADITAKKNLDA
jgi:hypothetical protein